MSSASGISQCVADKRPAEGARAGRWSQPLARYTGSAQKKSRAKPGGGTTIERPKSYRKQEGARPAPASAAPAPSSHKH